MVPRNINIINIRFSTCSKALLHAYRRRRPPRGADTIAREEVEHYISSRCVRALLLVSIFFIIRLTIAGDHS